MNGYDMTFENDITALLKAMTLEEKISLCHGCDSMSVGDIHRLGIGRVTMADGPQGVRREGGQTTTALPCGIALAATFDTPLAEEYGALIARECLASDIQASLGPGFNLARTPLNGRNFEYYGEDPVLAGEIAAGYIRGCQKLGVAACPKHIALNNQETCRTVTDVIIDERPLRELYLRAFEIVCEKSNPWMMMTALNRVNGVRATHNHFLLTRVAKGEFGFDGVMVSDWGAAKDAKEAALGGLDLDMGHGDNPVMGGIALKKLVESGEVPEAVIDDKARRMLRLFFRTGVFAPESRPRGELESPRHRELAQKIAIDSMVLLKNENHILPLKKNGLKRIAVIGPNANFRHSKGAIHNCGGSGAVYPAYEVTPLEGIKNLLGGDVTIDYAHGVLFENEKLLPRTLIPDGFKAEYFRPGEDEAFLTDRDAVIDKQWGNVFAAGNEMSELDKMKFRVHWTGKIKADQSGPVTLKINGSRIWGRLWLDGEEVIAPRNDIWWRQFIESHSFNAVAGREYDIRLEMERLSVDSTELKLLWLRDDDSECKRAIEIAKNADLVLFFGGSNHRFDREAIGGDYVPNADIPSLDLPDGQSELLEKLAEINPKVIVSLINGSVMNVEPWIDRVPALLECWYPGMEGGNAIAKVIFGEANPGGKLCLTWGKQLNDYACHASGNYPGDCGEDHPHVRYEEGIFIGYRHFDRASIEPRFPFGFGMSYTRFERALSNVSRDGTNINVNVEVTNTGSQAGSDVIQLYVRDVDSSEERPEKELRAFEKVHLATGETRAVSLKLTWRDFAFYSEKETKFIVEPGRFELILAASSRDTFATYPITL